MCGIWGAIATGFLANPAINEAGVGLFYGNPKQVLIQLISVVVTIIYAGVGTFILASITRLATGGIRVSEEDEIEGLDSAVHSERGFVLE